MSAERPDPATLLPHRGAAAWIVAVDARDAGGATCRAVIPAASAFVDDGVVPSFVAIEVAAQAAAVHEAMARLDAGGAAAPRAGLVVRARGVDLAQPDFPAGAVLSVRIDHEGGLPPLAQYRFRVTIDDAEIAHGAVSTYVPSAEPDGASEHA